MGAETKKKKSHLKTWICLYLAILVVLYIVIYAFPRVTGALTPTTVLNYGELKVWDEVTCYLVRHETVYTAEKGGAVNYYVPEGTMTRYGTKILEVTPASGGAIKGYNCAGNGTISYFIDGNETFFTPETMSALNESEVVERGKKTETTMRSSVLSGEPLYKLVDSDVWYAIYWVDQTEISKYQKDGAITIELPLGSVPGTVSDIVGHGDKWLVILKFDRYYEDMAKLRRVEATVVTEDYKGLVVPNESMVTVDGKIGVYVKSINGEYNFTRVSVITTDGESSLVKDSYFYEETGTEKGSVKVDTVEIYDEILKSGRP